MSQRVIVFIEPDVAMRHTGSIQVIFMYKDLLLTPMNRVGAKMEEEYYGVFGTQCESRHGDA